MRICKNNLLESATLTVNEESTAFPKENLVSDSLKERTRFDDYIVIDLGSTSQSVEAVSYGNNSDSITLEANAADSWGAPSFSQALTAEVTFISETYRYWRIYTGVSSSKIGYFALGGYIEFTGHTPETLPVPETTDLISETSGRQIYNTAGVVYDVERYVFPIASITEYNTFDTWYRSADRAKNHFIVPFEDDLSTFPPYFARLTDYAPTRDRRAYNMSLTFTEAK